MLDVNDTQIRIVRIGREDRDMLRSNLSARSMPEDGQEHVYFHMLLPSSSSFGSKAINLLSWCEAPTKVKQVNDRLPVGHMSVFNVRYPKTVSLAKQRTYRAPKKALTNQLTKKIQKLAEMTLPRYHPIWLK